MRFEKKIDIFSSKTVIYMIIIMFSFDYDETISSRFNMDLSKDQWLEFITFSIKKISKGTIGKILLDKLEEKMKGTIVDGEIKSLFCGTVRSYIKCFCKINNHIRAGQVGNGIVFKMLNGSCI
jgi:hypothetical protein